MDYFFGFFENLVRFQIDRFLTGLLCIFAVIAFLRYEDIIALKRGRNLFRLGGFLFIALIGLTAGMHLWRLPRGLSGTYYTNPSWSGEPVKLKRLFDPGKQNIDRVINLESHDFKRLARRAFSVIWQGYVYSPDEYHLDVLSNFDTWLYVDDILIDGPDKIDF